MPIATHTDRIAVSVEQITWQGQASAQATQVPNPFVCQMCYRLPSAGGKWLVGMGNVWLGFSGSMAGSWQGQVGEETQKPASHALMPSVRVAAVGTWCSVLPSQCPCLCGRTTLTQNSQYHNSWREIEEVVFLCLQWYVFPAFCTDGSAFLFFHKTPQIIQPSTVDAFYWVP